MRYKKAIVLLVPVMGLSIACGICSGKAASGSLAGAKSVVYAYEKETESDRIAVVNLDEGVAQNGKRVNYAEKISRFPSVDFEYASLEAARSGFESGKYGAYIIIPAVFSKNVESINAAPQVSQLEYAINRSYSGEGQYGLLYNVLSYIDTLGSKLSYMYVSNVLREFHEAQDDAGSVMENDQRDKEAIEKIEASDLIALTELPEMKQEKDTTEVLDISGYTAKDTELEEAVDEEYKRRVQDVRSQLDALSAGGAALSDILENLSEQVSEIDIMSDGKGESITEKADKKLEKELKEQSERAPDRESINRQLLKLKEKNEELSRSWEQSNRIYNENLDTELDYIRQQYLSDIQQNLPAFQLEYDTQGNLILTFEKSGEEEEPPSILFYRKEENEKDSDEDSEDTLNGIQEDAAKNCAAKNGAAGDAVDGGISDDGKAVGYSGDILAFTDYIRERCTGSDENIWKIPEAEGFLYDDKGRPVVDSQGNQRLCSSLAGENDQRIDALINEVSGAEDMDAGMIKELVKEEYTDPLKENAENAKEIFTQRYKEETDCVAVYQEQLASFRPQMDDGFLAGNMDELVKNHTLMQEALVKNNMAYKEYAKKTETAAQENVKQLKKHIEEVKEESDEAVEDGLREAKRIKEETSRVNQSVLKDFSRKLLYTRLGSAENTQVYQFMANPLMTSDKSAAPAAEGRVLYTEKKPEEVREEEKFPWPIVFLSAGILLLLLAVRGVYAGRRKNAVNHRREDSNVRRKKV